MEEFSKLMPHKDYQRLLDHSPTRIAWNNAANIISLIVQDLLAADGHPAAGVTSVLTNLASAAAFGLMYTMINQTYQAHEKIRDEVDSQTRTPDRPLDLEAASNPLQQTTRLRTSLGGWNSGLLNRAPGSSQPATGSPEHSLSARTSVSAQGRASSDSTASESESFHTAREGSQDGRAAR